LAQLKKCELTGVNDHFESKNLDLYSACKKTLHFWVFDKKTSKTRLSKFLKPRSFLVVNDCFKNENNAAFGLFLQRLYSFLIKAESLAALAQGLALCYDIQEFHCPERAIAK
jgi:hypothetical protein